MWVSQRRLCPSLSSGALLQAACELAQDAIRKCVGVDLPSGGQRRPGGLCAVHSKPGICAADASSQRSRQASEFTSLFPAAFGAWWRLDLERQAPRSLPKPLKRTASLLFLPVA